MDLETLKRFSAGELSPKQYLAVHQEAGELLDILQEHLGEHEWVTTVQDWPEPKRKQPGRNYMVLKTMILFTPLIFLAGGGAWYVGGPLGGVLTVLFLFGVFSAIAVAMLVERLRVDRKREGKSVLVVTNRRLMRVWLDGTEEVQAWWLGEDNTENIPIEAVSSTIKFLLELDLGKVNMN